MLRIGVIHSLSGTMAMSERSLVEAATLAIEQINAAGGLLGQTIEMVVADGASTPEVFASEARRLIERMSIRTLFGCWTSASRKAVRPVVEQAGALLWYPVQYEGLEQSPSIFYFGSTLNQQIEPAVSWCLEHLGKRFYLLGSDYVFPRTANRLVSALIEMQGGQIVGEEYLPLAAQDFSASIERIKAASPELVFNTLNGASNVAFYRQFAGSETPVMAVSVAEQELAAIGPAGAGHYACWGYFQSLDSEPNRQFVSAFCDRFGQDRVASDPIVSAYLQVRFWAEAVKKCGSFDPLEVRRAAIGIELDGPAGRVAVFPNQHVTKSALIGRANSLGQFDILYRSSDVIEPMPWLGIEKVTLPAARLIKEALAGLPAEIEHNSLLNLEIGRREKVEQDLTRLNMSLEQRVRQEVERNLEQERLLIQQSRLAAMGEMIHYIAHQWQQPLNALSILIRDWKDAFDFGELDAAYVADAVAHGARLVKQMSDTVEDFRNFFRPDKERVAFSLIESWRQVRAIIGGSLKNHAIRLEEDMPQDLSVVGMPNEFAQVLLNLVTNAKEAIALHQVAEGVIRVGISFENGRALVRIADNGGGISESAMPRIFDPYFSTKEKGSGIGLYMAKIIIENNMNGSISARNVDGGAEFTVSCPM